MDQTRWDKFFFSLTILLVDSN